MCVEQMQRKQMVLTELPPPKSATASFLIAIAAVSFTFSVVGILTGPETDAGNYGAAIKLVRIAGVGFISGWVAHVVLQSRLTLVRSAQVSFVAMHAAAAWQSRWDDLKDMNNLKLIFIYVALAAWALIYGLNGILVERHRYAHAPHYLLLLRTINSAKIFIVGLPLWCVSVYGRAGDHYKFMGTSTEEVLALALFFWAPCTVYESSTGWLGYSFFFNFRGSLFPCHPDEVHNVASVANSNLA